MEPFVYTITLDENSQIAIEQDSIVAISNLTIQGNGIPATSPLVAVNGMLTLGSGSTLRNRINTTGVAGIYVGGGGYFAMENDTLITNCENTGSIQPGGGIFVDGVSESTAVFSMYGGTISYCSALNGGGISLYNNVQAMITGGSIYECHSVLGEERGSGAGINIHGEAATALLSMTGGEIRTCTAMYGGGISSYNNVYILLDGGLIEDCTATGNGGGINGCGESANVTIYIQSGTIQSCYAPLGGGISAYQSVSIAMKGGTINLCDATESVGGAISQTTNTADLPGASASFAMRDGTISNCTSASSGGGLFMSGGNTSLSIEGGKIQNCIATKGSGGGIYARADTMTFIGGTIDTCTAIFNEGYSYTGGGLYASSNEISATLHLSGITIQNCSSSSGGGVAINGDVTAEMTGGLIDQCFASNSAEESAGNGAGIYCTGTVVFTMGNGTISNCIADQSGGGLFMSGEASEFFMTGGTISTCTATNNAGGGLATADIIHVELTGGKIENCSTSGSAGGGVSVSTTNPSTQLTLSGTINISSCSAQMGGGISVYGPVSVTMSGGIIDSCSAVQSGGGIVLNGAIMSMTGGTLSACNAQYGGGFYLAYGSTLTLSDTPVISNITHPFEQSGWAIYYDYGAYLFPDPDENQDFYGGIIQIYEPDYSIFQAGI